MLAFTKNKLALERQIVSDDLSVTLQKLKQNIEKKTVNHNQENTNLSVNTVTKSHALSRAYYRFNIVEKRCMEAMISKLHPLRGDNPQNLELRATDYAKAFGVPEKIAYRDLANATHNLMRRVITTSRTNGKKGKIELALMRRAEYMEDEGRIVCMFNDDVVPHLIGLREKFSSYPLKRAVNFSSSYTWRMYELLVSWAQPKEQTNGVFAGWFKVETQELRSMLGVPKSYSWGMLQKQVFDLATQELQEKSNIHLIIDRQKTGRKITHLNISFIESKTD